MRVHPDERNPLSDWPHEQPEVNAEREEEVRASLSASGQRIGLVVDDEANVAPQFARRPFANFEPVLYNAPRVLSSRNANFEDDVPLARSDPPEEWEVPTSWLLGRGTAPDQMISWNQWSLLLDHLPRQRLSALLILPRLLM